MTAAKQSADIPAKVRAQMFFSASVADARVLEKIREVTRAYFRGELGLAEARKRFARWIDARGIGDPTDRRMSNIASAARIDLILSQQAKMGAAVGRYQVSRDPDIEERYPCWRYIAGHNPRPEHATLSGNVQKEKRGNIDQKGIFANWNKIYRKKRFHRKVLKLVFPFPQQFIFQFLIGKV